MSEMTKFLLARLDEVEAEFVNTGHPAGWHTFECDQTQSEGYRSCDCRVPSLVRAECEAKRRIVELHTALDAEIRATFLSDPDTAANARLTRIGTEFALLCLASPYADHPDFNESWRP